MKTVRLFVIASAIGFSLTSLSALAHHSLGTYDQTTLVTIKGTITRIQWLNPHAWISLSVRNTDGTTSEVNFEIAAPGSLTRKGVTMDLFKTGDVLTFEAWVLKDPKAGLHPAGRMLTLADGRRFDVGDNFAMQGANPPR